MTQENYKRPSMSISNIDSLSNSYQKGKAVAYLTTLDKLNHSFEGSAVSILKQMDKHLNEELKKLGASVVVDVDGFEISKDVDIRLNMKRGNPLKEGTD